jgi:hypothetical protein
MEEYLSDLRGETRLEVLDPRLMGLDDAWKSQDDIQTAAEGS